MRWGGMCTVPIEMGLELEVHPHVSSYLNLREDWACNMLNRRLHDVQDTLVAVATDSKLQSYLILSTCRSLINFLLLILLVLSCKTTTVICQANYNHCCCC